MGYNLKYGKKLLNKLVRHLHTCLTAGGNCALFEWKEGNIIHLIKKKVQETSL